jgi:VanZ family protein
VTFEASAGPDRSSPGGRTGPEPVSGFGSYLFWLGPPIALMLGIWFMGTGQGSFGRTERVLAGVLEFLSLRPPDPELHALTAAIRKTGHFLAYALLAALDLRALRGLRGSASAAAPVAAWAAATAWAGVDEYHQSFFQTRGASPWDVALDSGGAATAVVLYWLWHRKRS